MLNLQYANITFRIHIAECYISQWCVQCSPWLLPDSVTSVVPRHHHLHHNRRFPDRWKQHENMFLAEESTKGSDVHLQSLVGWWQELLSQHVAMATGGLRRQVSLWKPLMVPLGQTSANELQNRWGTTAAVVLHHFSEEGETEPGQKVQQSLLRLVDSWHWTRSSSRAESSGAKHIRDSPLTKDLILYNKTGSRKDWRSYDQWAGKVMWHKEHVTHDDSHLDPMSPRGHRILITLALWKKHNQITSSEHTTGLESDYTTKAFIDFPIKSHVYDLHANVRLRNHHRYHTAV